MGCVRKRGKSWNAQVRVAGWRSFTKSFARKSDATSWIEEIENELRTMKSPRSCIQNTLVNTSTNSPFLNEQSLNLDTITPPQGRRV